MPLGKGVGLGPSYIRLDGDPVPPHGKGHSKPPIFGPLCSDTVAHLSTAELLFSGPPGVSGVAYGCLCAVRFVLYWVAGRLVGLVYKFLDS